MLVIFVNVGAVGIRASRELQSEQVSHWDYGGNNATAIPPVAPIP